MHCTKYRLLFDYYNVTAGFVSVCIQNDILSYNHMESLEGWGHSSGVRIIRNRGCRVQNSQLGVRLVKRSICAYFGNILLKRLLYNIQSVGCYLIIDWIFFSLQDNTSLSYNLWDPPLSWIGITSKEYSLNLFYYLIIW